MTKGTNGMKMKGIQRLARSATLALTVTGILAWQRAAAQTAGTRARPAVRDTRVTGSITVDGRLDEPDWSAAPVVTGFTQVDPQEGQPVSQRTEARILYDGEAIYIGARLYDDRPVSVRLGRRDMPLLDSDWFGVVIDSYHDFRTAFSFDVNPAGVQRDAVKTMRGSFESDDNSWDAVWDVATTVDDQGWTAEFRIPFSQLRFRSAGEQTWGLQLERVIGRRHEYAVLAFTPKTESGGIPTYADLRGLRDIRPGKRLEVLPYAVTRAEYVDPGPNPFRTDREYYGSAGVDLLYRVTSDFTLNATFNPDFGQVEVDPAVINLSVYETFFEEKRPFFVEGSEIFNFGRNTSGGQLFYSRRIGRRPQLRPPTARADVPDATTILGAGKLSGKTASGWSVGVLEAVTGRETARYLDPAEGVGQAVAEPLANYFVGRVRRDLHEGRSSFGAMLTAVNRRLDTDPARASLRGSAYAGGIDFRHEWAQRSWVLEGGFIGSRIAGEPDAIRAVQQAGNHFFQRPDADYLHVTTDGTSMSGYSTGLALRKQTGRHWLGGLAVAATSPEYEVNDLGFQVRTDRRDAQLDVAYQETRPGTFFRNYSIRGSVRYEHNYANQRILNIWSLSTSFRHLNFWGGSLYVGYMARANDDRLTRGGPMAERPAQWILHASASSDPRKSVTYSAGVGGSRNVYGGWGAGAGVGLGLKLSPRWNLSLSPSFNRSYTVAQYIGTVPDEDAIATYGAHYLFAPLHQTTLSMETRLNFTFTSKLSLQLYAQPFISSGDYGGATELAAPGSYRFTPWTGDAPSLDFNLRSLRGTAVLRWEWRPGSTLYLAWQQTRTDYAAVGNFDFARDVGALFSTPPDNILVLKVNYWLNP